jgi:hypothetical protein
MPASDATRRVAFALQDTVKTLFSHQSVLR